MLDVATLEVAFSVIALTVLVLFYLITFRRTRSKYSAWWCAAIGLFLAGSTGYLLVGTTQQGWALTTANTLLVAGATSVWAGARTLRTAGPAPTLLILPPALAAIFTALDHPGGNVWAGGLVFLFLMALMIGAVAGELWRLATGITRLQKPMAAAATLLAAYYFARMIALASMGSGSRVFNVFFGSAPTALLTMAMLVVASFSMTALSNEQVTRDLRARATHDELTRLLNRSGFLDLATDEFRHISRASQPGTLILADIDHFKTINDTYGHAGGDLVLGAFAAACTVTVRSTDLVGRYGGEEFILLLPGAQADHAQAITRQISAALAAMPVPEGRSWPTVSYGIAAIDPGTNSLNAVIAAADAALYEAKAQGRNRSVLARGVS